MRCSVLETPTHTHTVESFGCIKWPVIVIDIMLNSKFLLFEKNENVETNERRETKLKFNLSRYLRDLSLDIIIRIRNFNYLSIITNYLSNDQTNNNVFSKRGEIRLLYRCLMGRISGWRCIIIIYIIFKSTNKVKYYNIIIIF